MPLSGGWCRLCTSTVLAPLNAGGAAFCNRLPLLSPQFPSQIRMFMSGTVFRGVKVCACGGNMHLKVDIT